MPAASAISVLVVDDQMTIRSLVRSGLNQLGFKDVREAPDGEAALRAMLAKPSHLIISDYNMPDMDGLQLLEAVRGDAVIGKTVFIMLTGSSDRDLVQKAAALGVNNYLVKPFATAALKDKIERVFGAIS